MGDLERRLNVRNGRCYSFRRGKSARWGVSPHIYCFCAKGKNGVLSWRLWPVFRRQRTQSHREVDSRVVWYGTPRVQGLNGIRKAMRFIPAHHERNREELEEPYSERLADAEINIRGIPCHHMRTMRVGPVEDTQRNRQRKGAIQKVLSECLCLGAFGISINSLGG